MKSQTKPVSTLGRKATASVYKAYSFLFSLVVMLMPMYARADRLMWSTDGGDGDKIHTWFNTILTVIMAIFVMTSIVMGSLAFKQLASDGNWRDFWSKIAGAIGMFVVPVAIYWVVDNTQI